MQIQQPQIRVSARCKHPYTGQAVNLCANAFDAAVGGYLGGPHALAQGVEIEVVAHGSKGRTLAQFPQVLAAFP